MEHPAEELAVLVIFIPEYHPCKIVGEGVEWMD
jgi:hypothetical protein